MKSNRWGLVLALMAVIGMLPGCSRSPATGEEGAIATESVAPASLAEIEQALKAREAIYACIDLSFSVDRYSGMMSDGIKQAADQFYQQVGMVDSDIGRDAMMQNLKMNQDGVKDRFMPMISSFQRTAIPACRDVSTNYSKLAPRLANYPILRPSVEACAALADRMLKLLTWKSGDQPGTWAEVEPDMLGCRNRLEKAAKAAGITMHDTFAPGGKGNLAPVPAETVPVETAQPTPLPPSVESPIAKVEEPIGQPWITDADVHARAEPDQQWSSTLTYQVWEDGKAHKCTAVDAQGTMGAYLCSLTEARAMYKPAVKQDGSLARTEVTVKYGWN